MADLSKVRINNDEYNLKDSIARELLDNLQPETMANVKAMLAKYGLNTTTVYTAPNANTATANGTVLQS